MNDYIITIIHANPFDGCTKLTRPSESDLPDNPIFILVDGAAGICGYKRRAQMAKDYFGAKGLIIIDDKTDIDNDPYSSFED